MPRFRSQNTTKQSSSVRIIAGENRGRKIRFTTKNDTSKALRPTGDRVRETLFNWLHNEIPQARVLDLFAGTGVLGFEALSRGAKNCIFIERNSVFVQEIIANSKTLNYQQKTEIILQDALQWLDSHCVCLRDMDIIFLDPPFGGNHYHTVLRRLAQCISEHCLVYVEYNNDHEFCNESETLKMLSFKTIKHAVIANVNIALVSLTKQP